MIILNVLNEASKSEPYNSWMSVAALIFSLANLIFQWFILVKEIKAMPYNDERTDFCVIGNQITVTTSNKKVKILSSIFFAMLTCYPAFILSKAINDADYFGQKLCGSV